MIKKYLTIILGLVCLTLNIQAQTVEEAQQLFNDYWFEEAIEIYDKMAEKLIKAKKHEEAEALIPAKELAMQGSRMLSNCEDVQIIDSIVLDKEAFLDAYMIGADAGSLEKSGDKIYYINQLKDKRYFADKDSTENFRLFTELNLQGQWTERKKLNLHGDSLSNENYPFVLSDGLTIYYASTGNGSIGGYDLFMSRYNMSNDTYFLPAQLGMPFNSIYNDYMMVVDELNNIGYFATDRYQPEEKVVVYTFIPNDSFRNIDTEDRQFLIDRAKIVSIRDSWKSGANYTAYIQEIRRSIASEEEKAKREFYFVINDNIVYYKLDDFESRNARQAFLQSQDIKRQIDDLEQSLDAGRKEYALANNQKKSSMKNDLLKQEKRLEDLNKQYKRASINARNLEIRHLRQAD